MKVNENYLNLENNHLFADITKKIINFKKESPDADIIRMGIGDVTLPLPAVAVDAMKNAASEMASKETFRGYGEYEGYIFLKKSVRDYYKKKNVLLNEKEIFINDGAKSDLGNILDIFSADNTVLIPDPVYPAYVDTNIMAGRKITYINGNAENDFLPLPTEETKADIIYLCSPNNPTGAVYNRTQLEMWVNFAIEKGAVILFDAAYEAFVRDKSLPTSIYQIDGAEKCAIEFCSLSKTAGFTGIRCGYTVVPLALERNGISLNKLWLLRQSAKFNGVSYIVQRGAEAVFTDAGYSQISDNISYYLENAKIVRNRLNEMGLWFVGGENSPYIWLKCPDGMTSWEYFDYLLENANVAATPGAGFGKNGEGFLRLSAFGERESIITAMNRIMDISKLNS